MKEKKLGIIPHIFNEQLSLSSSLVRTLLFHSKNTGSNPVKDINSKIRILKDKFLGQFSFVFVKNNIQ
jgi:hypothetical protein